MESKKIAVAVAVVAGSIAVVAPPASAAPTGLQYGSKFEFSCAMPYGRWMPVGGSGGSARWEAHSSSPGADLAMFAANGAWSDYTARCGDNWQAINRVYK